jgi:hypothetical protein
MGMITLEPTSSVAAVSNVLLAKMMIYRSRDSFVTTQTRCQIHPRANLSDHVADGSVLIDLRQPERTATQFLDCLAKQPRPATLSRKGDARADLRVPASISDGSRRRSSRDRSPDREPDHVLVNWHASGRPLTRGAPEERPNRGHRAGSRSLRSLPLKPAPQPAGEVSCRLCREDRKMKPIIASLAIVAAVAIAAPAGAQQAPSTPSLPAPHPVQPLGRMPAGGPPTSERGITGSVERAHHRPHRVSSSHASQPVTPSPGTTKPTN